MIEWKLAVTELMVFIGTLTPLYHFVITLIKLERTAVIQRAQILQRLDFLEKRQDDADEWRSANSGLKFLK